MPAAEFDPFALLRVLRRHRVEFLVIGGIAAIAQGYPLTTRDLDITPSRTPDNLDRLAAALAELHAKLRLADGDELAFPFDGRFLAGAEIWTLATARGDLDVVFTPAGTRGYEDLRRAAVELDLEGPVLVASLADVIRSKEAAGRPKDQAQLPALRETLDRIRRR